MCRVHAELQPLHATLVFDNTLGSTGLIVFFYLPVTVNSPTNN